MGDVVIYQAPDGASSLQVHLDQETVWLSLNQMVDLFCRDKSVISRHLRNDSRGANCLVIQLLQNLQQLPQMGKYIRSNSST